MESKDAIVLTHMLMYMHRKRESELCQVQLGSCALSLISHRDVIMYNCTCCGNQHAHLSSSSAAIVHAHNMHTHVRIHVHAYYMYIGCVCV